MNASNVLMKFPFVHKINILFCTSRYVLTERNQSICLYSGGGERQGGDRVEEFKYLESAFQSNGDIEADVTQS